MLAGAGIGIARAMDDGRLALHADESVPGSAGHAIDVGRLRTLPIHRTQDFRVRAVHVERTVVHDPTITRPDSAVPETDRAGALHCAEAGHQGAGRGQRAYHGAAGMVEMQFRFLVIDRAGRTEAKVAVGCREGKVIARAEAGGHVFFGGGIERHGKGSGRRHGGRYRKCGKQDGEE